MFRTFITSKIHRATVTGANLHYRGSISLCRELIAAAGFLPFELVHVNGLEKGNHWETYVVPGKKGEVALHGPPAHLFAAGELVVINRPVMLSPAEVETVAQTVIHVDGHNRITDIIVQSAAEAWEGAATP